MIRTLALLLCASFAVAVRAAAPALPKVVACPYNAGELAVTLGMSFLEGLGKETPIPGGKQTTCAYAHANGHMTLHVKQTVMSVADHERGDAAFERAQTSPLVPITGDADGAKWQMDPSSYSNVTLHYRRGTHRVELRAQGGVKPAAAMQPKLLRLRRLP